MIDDSDGEKASELVALGVDSPLKLDLLGALARSAERSLGLEALVAACGGSGRDVAATLEELASARIVERRSFYNLAEYAIAARPGGPGERVTRALGRSAGDTRRLRLALLRHGKAESVGA